MSATIDRKPQKTKQQSDAGCKVRASTVSQNLFLVCVYRYVSVHARGHHAKHVSHCWLWSKRLWRLWEQLSHADLIWTLGSVLPQWQTQLLHLCFRTIFKPDIKAREQVWTEVSAAVLVGTLHRDPPERDNEDGADCTCGDCHQKAMPETAIFWQIKVTNQNFSCSPPGSP